MPKGLYTAAAVVLLERAPVFETVERQLARFEPRAAEPGPSWEFGGPCCTLPYRPQSNGYLVVDLVDRPWPDGMGHPEHEPQLFGAWATGQFGPFTYPASLQRALQQCHSWPAGPEQANRHTAFLRLRMTWVINASADAPVLPANYDALAELHYVTDVALTLLDLPEALAYFNPGGEVLSHPQRMRQLLAHYRASGLPPLDLWTNLRMFARDNGEILFDTVGMGQVDLDDLEVVCRGDVDADAAAEFLRNASLYVGKNGPTIKDGHTMDGPDGRYVAKTLPEAEVVPPRGVLRFRRERKKLLGLF